MTDKTESLIITNRLRLLESEYRSNPIGTIKSILGTDINIIKIQEMNYIDNGYIVINIIYKLFKFNPLKLYFIEKKKLKPLEQSTNKYMTEVNGTPILITISNLFAKHFNKSEYYPIYIRKTINTSNLPYNHYGLIQSLPLNSYSSISNFEHKRYLCNYQEAYEHIRELFAEKDKKFTNKLNKSDSTDKYSKLFNNTIFASIINNYKRINSISEIDTKHSNIAYIVNINQIIPDMNGVVIVSFERDDLFDVLYIPVRQYMITKEDWSKIISFMYNDYVNYTNFIKYCSFE